MSQPITADEGDANIDWDVQTGVSMPSPYPQTYLNAVTAGQMPTAVNMATINVDISTTEKRDAYYRFVKITT